LIQRNEETTLPMLYYSKLPPSIASKRVILLDLMLGTGGSAKCAVNVLLESGVKEENIYFFTVVFCPQGINAVSNAYPSITIVTGMMDAGLNEKAYIVPGLGDFGDRFFGTLAGLMTWFLIGSSFSCEVEIYTHFLTKSEVNMSLNIFKITVLH